MWKRNLLLLGLVVGGVGTLVANLMPPREPKPATRYDASAYQAQDFRASVADIDAAFHKVWQGPALLAANIVGSRSQNSLTTVLVACCASLSPSGQHKGEPITPAQGASDLAIARRLALGLMGTVPSLEEIRQFEWLPTSSSSVSVSPMQDERLAWWTDHILQDSRFNDYVAERLARACVGTEDGPFILYRRRRFVTWLSEQLAKDRPYDQMVHDLIASKGLWTDKPATNFVTVTIKPDKQNQPDPIRLAGRVTRAFLGIRLDCAECHNHPFREEWKQSDFRGLAAFFGQTHIGFSGVQDGSGEFEAPDKKTHKDKVFPPSVPFSRELVPEDGSRREQLAAWVANAKNPWFARATVNRVWALMLGRPLVEPVDNLEAAESLPLALQVLADDFVAHDFDLRRLIRVIASTQAFRLDSASDKDCTEDEKKAWAVFPMTRLRPEQVIGSVIQASSVATIDAESHIFVRTLRLLNQNDFVKRYGDSGEDEFGGRGGTIPQRLLMMNGQLVNDRIKPGPFTATTRIAMLAPDDAKAVESVYLTVLTRRPTKEEAEHFEQFLAEETTQRPERMEDIYWTLINSTEFSWNH